MVEKENIIIIEVAYINNLEYFKKVEESVICNICCNILNNPKTCSVCENFYCSSCLIDWNKNDLDLKCPMKCPNSNFNNSTPRVFKNIISQLEFTCIKECGSIILYNDYISHVNSCMGKLKSCPVCSSLICKDKLDQYNENLKLKLENEDLTNQISSLNEKLNRMELDFSSYQKDLKSKH